MATPVITVVHDEAAMAALAAEHFARAAAAAVAASGRFRVALSGGSTARSVYEHLAAAHGGAAVDGVPWERVQVFWGDERCVGPDHRDSNYGMARDALLRHVPVPPQQIHRMEGERAPHEAADAYEAILRREFALQDEQVPVFDLMLLGIGPDGHTASLFPGSALEEEERRLVTTGWVPAVGAWRISLTLPVLAGAAAVYVLLAGADKSAVASAVLGPHAAARDLPAHRVISRATRVTVVLDRAAAVALDPFQF